MRLIPTHITHAYVQQMPYSFVWLYVIKCDAHTQPYVDQTQKYFWVFYLFLENVFVLKIFKNSKNFQLCLLVTHLQVASFKALIARLHRSVHDSLASETSNCEKYLENFSKIKIFVILATPSQVEV